MRLLFAVLLLCLGATRTTGQTRELAIGIPAHQGADIALGRYSVLKELLEQGDGTLAVRLVPMPPERIPHALSSGAVAMAVAHPLLWPSETVPGSGFRMVVTLRERGPQEESLRDIAGTVVIRNEPEAPRILQDLRGKRVAASHPHHVAGTRLALKMLREANVPLTGSDRVVMIYTGSDAQSLVKLTNREVDAAFLPAGQIEQMLTLGSVSPDAFLVLASPDSSRYPYAHSTPLAEPWSLIARDDVPEAILYTALARLITASPEGSPLADSPWYGFGLPEAHRKMGPAESSFTSTWADVRLRAALLGILVVFLILLVAWARTKTQIRSLQEDVQDSHKARATVLDAMEDGYVVVDRDGRILDVNRAILALLEYSRNELLGANLLDTIMRLTEGGTLATEEHNHVLRTSRDGAERRGRHVLVTKDGRLVQVFLIARAAIEDRSSVYVLVRELSQQLALEVERDTAVQRMEEALRELEDWMAHADLERDARSEFLSNISHDIRTPLNGVLGMTDLLLDSPLSDEQRQRLHIVREGGLSLIELINDLFEFSALESGTLVLDNTEFDLQEELDRFTEIQAPRAHDKRLDFLVAIDDGIPTRLQGDSRRLAQILNNFVGNSIKLTKAGDVMVHVQLESFVDNDVELRFTIRDTGLGVADGRVALLFSHKMPGQKDLKNPYGGAGLGFTMTRQLVEMMGGTVGMDVQIGFGSTFWFTAKFRVQDYVEEIQTLPLRDEPLRVLVVDDHAPHRALVGMWLSQWDVEVDEAENAALALKKLREPAHVRAPYEMVLADMDMPVMGGDGLVKVMLSERRLQSIRPILMVPLGKPLTEDFLQEIRGAAVMHKPLSKIGLFAFLKTYIESSTLPDVEVLLRDSTALLGRLSASHTAISHTVITNRLASFNARVLVVEDNPINQQVAMGMLRKLGIASEAANNGQEALDKLAVNRYDAVLMDVQMPLMDGIEATRILRSAKFAGESKGVAVIAMTANAMQGDRELCIEAGMDNYLSKPINVHTLADRLEQWLNKSHIVNRYSSNEAGGSRASLRVVPTFDASALLSRHRGNLPAARARAEVFVHEMPPHVSTLVEALLESDKKTTERVAKALKELSAEVTAEDVRTVAYQIEQAARANALPVALVLLPELEKQFEAACEALEGWLEQTKSA